MNCCCNNLIISCLPFCWLFFWLSNFTASCSFSSVSWYFSTIDCNFSSLMLYFAIFSRPVFWISSLKWCTSSLWRRVMAVPNEINTKSQARAQSLFTRRFDFFKGKVWIKCSARELWRRQETTTKNTTFSFTLPMKHHMTLVSNLLSPKRVNSNWVRVSPNKGRRKISIKKIKDQTIHLHSCNPETSFPKHLIYFELYNLRIQFVCIFGGIWEWNEEIREENFQKSVGISCILCLLFAYRVAL